jgi:hypothetical protein
MESQADWIESRGSPLMLPAKLRPLPLSYSIRAPRTLASNPSSRRSSHLGEEPMFFRDPNAHPCSFNMVQEVYTELFRWSRSSRLELRPIHVSSLSVLVAVQWGHMYARMRHQHCIPHLLWLVSPAVLLPSTISRHIRVV